MRTRNNNFNYEQDTLIDLDPSEKYTIRNSNNFEIITTIINLFKNYFPTNSNHSTNPKSKFFIFSLILFTLCTILFYSIYFIISISSLHTHGVKILHNNENNNEIQNLENNNKILQLDYPFETYITLLLNDNFSKGAIALIKSLKLTKTKRRIICIVSEGKKRKIYCCFFFLKIVNIKFLFLFFKRGN